MKKPKLTPEELSSKRDKENLTKTANRLRSKFNFKEIKTYLDVLRVAGYPDSYIFQTYFPSELNRTIEWSDINEYITDKSIELSTRDWLRKNPPDLSHEDDDNFGNIEATTQIDVEVLPPEQPLILKDKKSGESEEDYEHYKCSSRTKAFLFWFQKKAVIWLLEQLTLGNNPKRGLALIAGTGTGKTFIAGEVLAKLIDLKFSEGKTKSPWPLVYVTKASVVEQTKRVFETYFGLTEDDVLVINIDQLRSRFGKIFVKEKCYIQQGVEIYKYEWNDHIYPIFIWWDECQALKNQDSGQSRIGQSYNDIPTDNTFQVFSSATHGTRVDDMKCFTVASRVPYTYGVARDAPMTNAHFSDFANNIASNFGSLETKPYMHDPPAMDRFADYMSAYIYRVKGVKPQFHAQNSVQIISFETEEGKKFYDSAWDRFQAKKAELLGDDAITANEARMNILAALTVFRMAAESNPDRVHLISRDMYNIVQSGKAAFVAVNFKITIVKCVDILVNDFGVSRDQISLIWGGYVPTKKAKKIDKQQRLKNAITSSPDLMDQLEDAGISMKDLDLDEIEEKEYINVDPKLRLGTQTKEARQKEIDRFQAGKALYCFYTFRAGGVGLSLHHCDELTREKVRRKPSGYAYEEDIPNIPTREREGRITPTYSAIELVQGLGRGPRLTSLSNTKQVLQFYRGTIEERVAYVVSMKLRSLSKLNRNKESWEDMVIGKETPDEVISKMKLVDKKPDEPEEDNEILGDDEDDE